jgi:hypothetical protein
MCFVTDIEDGRPVILGFALIFSCSAFIYLLVTGSGHVLDVEHNFEEGTKL